MPGKALLDQSWLTKLRPGFAAAGVSLSRADADSSETRDQRLGHPFSPMHSLPGFIRQALGERTDLAVAPCRPSAGPSSESRCRQRSTPAPDRPP